jgi:AcrR family transcriptional regulator
MPKGTTKRRPQTTARLLDAALEVFAERGFHGASIEDICERAGFTRGAFYSNFRSKDELFFALFDRHADRVLARTAALLHEAGDGAEAIAHVIDLASRLDEDDRRWYLLSTEFTLHAVREPSAARALAAHDARLRAAIRRLVAELLLRAGRRATVDLDDLARLVVAMREGGLAQALGDPDGPPPGHLERAFLPALLIAASEPLT